MTQPTSRRSILVLSNLRLGNYRVLKCLMQYLWYFMYGNCKFLWKNVNSLLVWKHDSAAAGCSIVRIPIQTPVCDDRSVLFYIGCICDTCPET